MREAAVEIDPDLNAVRTASGTTIGYDHLVVCPGIQLDWHRTPGLAETLGRDGVSSNYRFDLAPRTWEFIHSTRRGTAVFTMPSGPVKCAGAAQKIAYLASDHWRREGVLDRIDVHLVVPTPRIFGIDAFADVLDAVIARYGITLHTECEMTEVDPDGRRAIITDHGRDGERFELCYDLLHAVPHQSAPDWVKATVLAAHDPNGYVEVDQHTLQHVRWPNVFALGDAASTPNAKTGAAVRKQAPVVVRNLLDVMAGRPPSAGYGGYSSCPMTTARDKVLLPEFDYAGRPTPSIPLLDMAKERRSMWLLKRYGLPFLYWHLMLKGRL
jgi:sulfide:quinone oxidoreductase